MRAFSQTSPSVAAACRAARLDARPRIIELDDCTLLLVDDSEIIMIGEVLGVMTGTSDH